MFKLFITKKAKNPNAVKSPGLLKPWYVANVANLENILITCKRTSMIEDSRKYTKAELKAYGNKLAAECSLIPICDSITYLKKVKL